MRRALLALALAFLAGTGLLVWHGSKQQRPTWQSIYVPAYEPVAQVPAGGEGCEGPIWLARDFYDVSFVPDRTPAETAKGAPRPPLVVRVLESESKKLLATVRLPTDPLPGGGRQAQFGRLISADKQITVCIRNVGKVPMVLWGVLSPHEGMDNPYRATLRRSQSDATVDGKRISGDFTLDFGDPESGLESLVALLPESFERASSFKVPILGAWTFWLLAALLVIAAPVLLALALRRAADEDDAVA